MQAYRSAVFALTAAVAVASYGLVGAAQSQAPLPLEPLGIRGEAVWPAFEGWGRNPDGTVTLLLGYYNRNQNQILDIPIGPNNQIEPGGPDQGQPTQFLTGRQWGVFGITVPKDFGNKRFTWTLVANGQTATVSFWLNPAYFVEYFKNQANGNEPPVIKFAPGGPDLQGPPRGMAASLSTTGSEPVTLTLWATDKPPTIVPPPPGDGAGAGRGGRGGRGGGPPPAVIITWTKHRGPGVVTFTNPKLELPEKSDGKATTMATFSAPGDYILRATANDSSGDGGGGDQCCWTTAHVKVTVSPGSSGR